MDSPVGIEICRLTCSQVIYVFHLSPFRLQQVDENRKSVTNEIKKSICNLILEINRKGKILVNQLEVRLLYDIDVYRRYIY